MWRIILILVLLLTSCSDEFAPFIRGTEPTAVMYGLINVDDSVNSVRITKSFYGGSSAHDLAKDTNELFYEDLSAKIQCLRDDSVFSEYPLVKTYIPLDTTGIFQTPKNWVYAYIGQFPPRDSFRSIRVVVVLSDGDTVKTSRLHVFTKPQMVYPNKASKTISLYNDGALKIDIFHYMKVGIKIRVNYTEMINGNEVSKSLEKFIYRINYSLFNITPGRFISILNENIMDNPNVEYRKIQSIDIFGYSAGNAFLYYHKIIGTDYDFTKSPYNYIENGTGLVLPYSKDSVMGLQFDQETMDSIVNGEFMKKFHFVKWN